MRKAVEIIKSVVLVFLALLMLVLWTAYIYLQFDRKDDKLVSLNSDFWAYTNLEKAPTELSPDSTFFAPSSVSIVLSSRGYTSAYDTKLTEVLYGNCTQLLNEVFSSTYFCRKAPYSAWEEALLQENSILIEYPAQMPYTTVLQFVDGDNNRCGGEICYIQKLILFSRSSNALCAVSCDSDGNVHTFDWNSNDSPSFIYDFNSNNLAAYTVNEGFIPFSFNLGSDSKKQFSSLPSDYKLLETAPSLPTVSVTTPLQGTLDTAFSDEDSSYLELVEDDALESVLDAFEINPNIVGYYSDPDSGLIFVGENMHFSISTNGNISYSLIDDSTPAITASSLLNAAGTSFSHSDLLTAATVFINKLYPHILGGEAVPTLKGMSYSSQSGEYRFVFGYTYRGADLVIEDKNAVTLTFNSSGLVDASLVPMTLSVYDGETPENTEVLTTDILPSVAARLTEGGNIKPIYLFEDYNDTITPFWAAGGERK